jgi:lipopolysaccharide transport system permease protein
VSGAEPGATDLLNQTASPPSGSHVVPKTVAAAADPTTVIEARPETLAARLRALWRYRGFYGFVFREILMRKARGTLLGFWWLILRPLIPAAGFIVAFTVVAPLETGAGIPYPVFFLSGFVPWRLFQGTLTILPRSLMWTRAIMRRTYFPRLLVPLAAFGPALIELAILCVVFVAVVVALMWSSGAPPPIRVGWETLWLLPCLVGALALALAFGIVLSVVALFFRDVVFSIGYVVQLFMFVTPVLYPVTAVPESYRTALFVLNPMAQIVHVSRWAITGHGEFEPVFVVLAFATITLALMASVAFFLRAEAHLGDQM